MPVTNNVITYVPEYVHEEQRDESGSAGECGECWP